MARAYGQKLKLFRLYQILLRSTDENHPMKIAEIIKRLDNDGIPAERKSLYDDFRALEDLGFIVEKTGNGYYLDTRLFDTAELKLLTDAVQSARFISKKKSKEIVSKLESTVSEYEARVLSRQIDVADRAKTENAAVLSAVDSIHNAIAQNRRVRFRYFDRDLRKNKVYRKDGAYYEISPFSLAWYDDNYYVIGYSSEHNEIRHYRVDRMANTHISDISRDGAEFFRHFDLGQYTKSHFGMFSGTPEPVTLRCRNRLSDLIFDRFGEDVHLIPDGDDFFRVTVDLYPSRNFLAFTLGFGEDMRILSPASAVAAVRELLRENEKQYGEPPES